MDAGMAVDRASERAPLPALARWAAGSLAGIAVFLTYLQVFVIRGGDPPLALIFGLPALLFAIPIVATRKRWAPLLGIVYWALFFAGGGQYIAYDLTHPDGGNFGPAVGMMLLAVPGVIAALGATVQNYRRDPAAPAGEGLHTPRWFTTALIGLVSLSIGAVLVSAVPHADAAAGVSPQVRGRSRRIVGAVGRCGPGARPRTGRCTPLERVAGRGPDPRGPRARTTWRSCLSPGMSSSLRSPGRLARRYPESRYSFSSRAEVPASTTWPSHCRQARQVQPARSQ